MAVYFYPLSAFIGLNPGNSVKAERLKNEIKDDPVVTKNPQGRKVWIVKNPSDGVKVEFGSNLTPAQKIGLDAVIAHDGQKIDEGQIARWFTRGNAPDANDDSDSTKVPGGYKLTDVWMWKPETPDNPGGRIFVCVDRTEGAAVWLLIGGAAFP